jgi:tight adherence protein B
MSWLQSTLEGAGLARFSPGRFVLSVAVAAVLTAVWVAAISGVTALGVCVGVASLGLAFELLVGRAKSRRRDLAKLWPEVVETLLSGISSGGSLEDGFGDLAKHGPLRLRRTFATALKILDSGSENRVALQWLKAELGEANADRTIELLQVVAEVGGTSLANALRAQAKQIRQDTALWGEIESKQGWVVGTAKLAVASPWLIVSLLAVRPENAAVYNSSGGATILALGLLVSVFAYRLIHFLSVLPASPRIFAVPEGIGGQS